MKVIGARVYFCTTKDHREHEAQVRLYTLFKFEGPNSDDKLHRLAIDGFYILRDVKPPESASVLVAVDKSDGVNKEILRGTGGEQLQKIAARAFNLCKAKGAIPGEKWFVESGCQPRRAKQNE